ncbi:ATP-dependent protease La (LON) domain [Seminavis robusta]|uniref:ATP-dependent protease La (LON) domain n=1 Tax=Seminavis robusta TaxID=568900 RepID=A0A9N8H477_9STRA|nr:ATP-dependent protease La (LON) domain [Seminavis robusta]|eukprot:Sro107_g053690.1 ATP-dependent protease La (LON) domain (484) ;mRNA; f:3855-5648
MRFGVGALTVALALCGASVSTTEAFSGVVRPSPRRAFGVAWSAAPTSLASGIKTRFVSTSATRRQLAAGDDEEDGYDEPLAKGVDSVSWLPTVAGSKMVETSSDGVEDAQVLPLFPLGGIVYTPNSEHVLNIFEPRYRSMYNDILMNGTKRFVVSMSHPTEAGRFAQMGVLFELQELKEVSEQTADQIKYICNHRVTGRVKIHRVLNPDVWESRSTYLRVEGTIFDDSGRDDEDGEDDDETSEAVEEKKDESMANDVYGAVTAALGKYYSKEEKSLKDAFGDLVEIQHELEEDVRFTKASVLSLAVKPGPGKDGLWQTVRLWQSFADQRLMARQNDLQKDFQEKLQEFLKKEKGLKDEELPSAIGFQDLSPGLQQEVQDLQKRMAVELQPLVLESTLTMQKLLETESHEARCKLLQFFVEAERKRLATKKSLAGMFAGETAGSSADIPEEERLGPSSSSKSSSSDDSSASSKSILTDEPDAWG